MNNQQTPSTPLPVHVPQTVYRAFFTPKTLAAYLSVSESTARQLIADRKIDSIRIAGARRIPPEAVDEYVKRHRVPAVR